MQQRKERIGQNFALLHTQIQKGYKHGWRDTYLDDAVVFKTLRFEFNWTETIQCISCALFETHVHQIVRDTFVCLNLQYSSIQKARQYQQMVIKKLTTLFERIFHEPKCQLYSYTIFDVLTIVFCLWSTKRDFWSLIAFIFQGFIIMW